jgi:hypothetical protein
VHQEGPLDCYVGGTGTHRWWKCFAMWRKGSSISFPPACIAMSHMSCALHDPWVEAQGTVVECALTADTSKYSRPLIRAKSSPSSRLTMPLSI